MNAVTSHPGIPTNATLASLNQNGISNLPPARSEAQLELQVHLTTIVLTDENDYYECEIAGKVRKKYSTGAVYTYLS
ncbi:hypothetical protein IGI04_042841 [Brassica rapa subsp. trilocularis]|uniref:Uncharacterized protein n=1 Tax=Brassica rapa subsp. trilocularis TaxID=1813537 RepID=A0ABQ7KJZ7_BRACM|nr:hypothetical protein IGI04_042833 [Brassica rapa subsp. trilocularis]KAG5373844.1 hypothetical protein IGI04_042837 [Brassica rapa subsp. trilocularis]KAG5373848.1 hypothetical protein IGI04_042841 [Brassica rapa subsp. trilocularis]